MKKFLFLVLLFGCSSKNLKESKYKYVVFSTFNEVVLETDDKTKAYETAHGLTLMGRVLASKPVYFVKENK